MSRRLVAGTAAALMVVSVLGGTAPTPIRAALIAVPVNDAYTTGVDERLEIEEPGVLANDLDISLGETRVQLTNDVDHGHLSLNHDGGFDYKPDDGFSGVDTFRYRLEGLLSTPATVTITVKAPAPTPTPTPTATPTPTPTPTPRPTILPTLPPLPTLLPLPTLPPIVPTVPPVVPTPSSTAPAPSATPTPGASSVPAPSTPSPSGTSAPGGVPAGPVGPSGPGASSGGTGDPLGPSTPPLQIAGPAGASVDLGPIDVDGTGLAIQWLVPTLVVTVPGLLLMLAILAQGAGALLWLPYAKRTLDDDRRRRPRGRRTR